MLFSGCVQSNPDPIQFNDTLVRLQKEVRDKIILFSDQIGATQPIEETHLLQDVQEIKTLIDKDIATLETLPTPRGGEAFKAAIKGLLEFYNHVCDQDFPTMVKLLAKPDASEEDAIMLNNLQQSIQDQEAIWNKKVQDAQSNFARIYHITIQ